MTLSPTPMLEGAQLYTCSLDAEGAFDAIPHCVLFKKASKVLPDYCWHVMVNLYEKLTVQIRLSGANNYVRKSVCI